MEQGGEGTMPFFTDPSKLIPMVGGAVLVIIFIFVWVYASRYVKAGPNEVLVSSGRRREITSEDGRKQSVGFRIRVGGGAFVWPILERVDILSLELMTIEVKTPE